MKGGKSDLVIMSDQANSRGTWQFKWSDSVLACYTDKVHNEPIQLHGWEVMGIYYLTTSVAV